MAQTLHQRVAAEVRAELGRHRLSGSALARKLGWGQQYVSRRLSGEVPFDVNDLDEIANALGVPVSTFLEVAA